MCWESQTVCCVWDGKLFSHQALCLACGQLMSIDLWILTAPPGFALRPTYSKWRYSKPVQRNGAAHPSQELLALAVKL